MGVGVLVCLGELAGRHERERARERERGRERERDRERGILVD